MHIIKVKTLRGFWERHHDAEQPLRTWVDIVRGARWQNQEDVKASYPGISSIGGNRFVFKRLKGNKYRLVVKVNFKNQTVFVRFIGSHAQYDKIDAVTI